MIIFDLDGTLADCEHRRYLVEPENYPNLVEYSNYRMINGVPHIDCNEKASWRFKSTGEPFQHGFKAFYEACDQDKPIEPTIISLRRHSQHDRVQIWSGRCESVRDKTIDWFDKHISGFAPRSWFENNLKMRPIGDNTPDEVLKEKWLDEYLAKPLYDPLVPGNDVAVFYRNDPIQMVFDDRPKVVAMWRRRGIFVFDCNQTGKIF